MRISPTSSFHLTLLLLLPYWLQVSANKSQDVKPEITRSASAEHTRVKRQIRTALRSAIDDMKWKINNIGLTIDNFVLPKVQYAAEKIRNDVGPAITNIKDLTNRVVLSTAQNIQKGAQFLSEHIAPVIEDTVVEMSNAAVPVVNKGIDAVGTGLQNGVNVVSQTTSTGIEHLGQKVLGEQRHTRIKKIANNLSVNFNNSINNLAGAIKKVTTTDDQDLISNQNYLTPEMLSYYGYSINYNNAYIPNMYYPYHVYNPTYLANYYPNNQYYSNDETTTEVTVPNALGQIVSNTAYSISTQLLGPNLTEAVAPIARSVSKAIGQNLPSVSLGTDQQEPRQPDKLRTCTTPSGGKGFCQDLSDCPDLVLKLSVLRSSICFKSIVRPGVCCPDVGQLDKLKEKKKKAKKAAANSSKSRPTAQTNRPLTPSSSFNAANQAFIQPGQQQSGLQLHTPGLIINPNYPYLPGATFVSPGAPIVANSPSSTSSATVRTNEKMAKDNAIINKSFTNKNYECGVPRVAQSRVVGGEESHIGEWPWTVAIYLHGPKKTEFWCGGSLISEEYVITAAHCTKDSNEKTFDAGQFSVHLGDYKIFNEEDDRISPPKVYGVRHINPHPDFKRHGYFNDIALIKLSRNVEFSEYISPVCLPPESIERSSLDALVGQTPSIIGYGSTYYDGPQSNTLRDVKLPIWKNSDCNKAYFQPITDVFLCAGYVDGGKDACQGDSGGPMMLYTGGRWIQLGIVSFGNRCAEPGYPGVYTRVAKFLPWIRSNLR